MGLISTESAETWSSASQEKDAAAVENVPVDEKHAV